MLNYCVWRDLVEAFIKLQASQFGYRVVRRTASKSSRSLYLVLDQVNRCQLNNRVVQGKRCVRLSDHRGRRSSSPFVLDVLQRSTGRLRELQFFLVDGVRPKAARQLGRTHRGCVGLSSWKQTTGEVS